MTSMLTLLENKTVMGHSTFQSEQPIHKKENQIKKYVPYAAVPVGAIAGGLLGYDKFQKEKTTVQNEFNALNDTGLWKKELELKNNINKSFKYLVYDMQQGYTRDMPNCLMIEGNDASFSEKLIDWIGTTSGANYKKINVDDDIVEHLEKIEERYPKTKNWTLLHIEDMDKLIDHSQTKDRVVESMKDIMSASATDYHTTIIFSAKNRDKLDHIAIQPHRVRKIFNIDGLSEEKFFFNIKSIDNYDAKQAFLENASKHRNQKVAKYVLAGLTAGAAITAGIKILLKNLKKERA